jgi:hypothetical protein
VLTGPTPGSADSVGLDPTAELPVRPSVSSAPMRQPADPIPLTPLFGGARETVTDATVGFGFRTDADEEEPPVGRRPSVPWATSPLLDLAGNDADDRERRTRRTKLALAGLAATALPVLGLVAVVRGSVGVPVDTGNSAAPPEVVSVTYTIDRPTNVPGADGSTSTAPESTEATTTAPPAGAGASTTAPLPPPPPAPLPPPPSNPATSRIPATRGTTTTTVPPIVAAPPLAPLAIEAPTDAERDFLACIRGIESRNNYQAVDPSRTYFGAYQMSQETWDGIARQYNRADLVGVRPDTRFTAVQDSMALALKRRDQARPWNNACADRLSAAAAASANP